MQYSFFLTCGNISNDDLETEISTYIGGKKYTYRNSINPKHREHNKSRQILHPDQIKSIIVSGEKRRIFWRPGQGKPFMFCGQIKSLKTIIQRSENGIYLTDVDLQENPWCEIFEIPCSSNSK